MVRKTKQQYIIGKQDKIDLPEFNLNNLSCKVDTGADSSSIHCHKVRIKEIDGKEVLSFRLLDPLHPHYQKKDFFTTEFIERKVKNSFGDSEYRYFIRTKVLLFGKEFQTEFSLSDRAKMKYPVLLGRKILASGFLVDVTQKNISYKKKINSLKK